MGKATKHWDKVSAVRHVLKRKINFQQEESFIMGLKSSILLHEEDIEELQNETGCKLKEFDRQIHSALSSDVHLWIIMFFITICHLIKCLIVVSSVSSNQIRRLYSRFKSLDKATKGTLRFVKCADLEPFVFDIYTVKCFLFD